MSRRLPVELAPKQHEKESAKSSLPLALIYVAVFAFLGAGFAVMLLIADMVMNLV
jgi:hypothetical protein